MPVFRSTVSVIIISRLHQLAVVLGIFVSIPFAVVKSPLVEVVAIPPYIIYRHFLLDNATSFPVLQLNMLICILAARCHPVAIAETTLFQVGWDCTVHLYRIFLTSDNGTQVIDRLERCLVSRTCRYGVGKLPFEVMRVDTRLHEIPKGKIAIQLSFVESVTHCSGVARSCLIFSTARIALE